MIQPMMAHVHWMSMCKCWNFCEMMFNILSLGGVAVALIAILSLFPFLFFSTFSQFTTFPIIFDFRLIHSFSTSFCYHSLHSKRISDHRYSMLPSIHLLVYSAFRLFVCLFIYVMYGLSLNLMCLELEYGVLLVVCNAHKNSVSLLLYNVYI